MTLHGYRCPACRTWFEAVGGRVRCNNCGARVSAKDAFRAASAPRDTAQSPAASASCERPAYLGRDPAQPVHDGPGSRGWQTRVSDDMSFRQLGLGLMAIATALLLHTNLVGALLPIPRPFGFIVVAMLLAAYELYLRATRQRPE